MAAATAAAMIAAGVRRYGLCYLVIWFNVFTGGYLTAVERQGSALTISMGRGLVLQAAVLLALAATAGGSTIWFTPLCSEVICAGMALVFLRGFLKKGRDS